MVSVNGSDHLSARELAAQLGSQLSRLVRAEIALAKAELFASARQAILGGGLLAAAGIVGFTAWLAFVAAVIAGIGRALPVWAAALITGGALAAIAGLLALAARSRMRRGTPPLRMTADSVRTDVGVLSSRTSQAGKDMSDAIKPGGRQ